MLCVVDLDKSIEIINIFMFFTFYYMTCYMYVN